MKNFGRFLLIQEMQIEENNKKRKFDGKNETRETERLSFEASNGRSEKHKCSRIDPAIMKKTLNSTENEADSSNKDNNYSRGAIQESIKRVDSQSVNQTGSQNAEMLSIGGLQKTRQGQLKLDQNAKKEIVYVQNNQKCSLCQLQDYCGCRLQTETTSANFNDQKQQCQGEKTINNSFFNTNIHKSSSKDMSIPSQKVHKIEDLTNRESEMHSGDFNTKTTSSCNSDYKKEIEEPKNKYKEVFSLNSEILAQNILGSLFFDYHDPKIINMQRDVTKKSRGNESYESVGARKNALQSANTESGTKKDLKGGNEVKNRTHFTKKQKESHSDRNKATKASSVSEKTQKNQGEFYFDREGNIYSRNLPKNVLREIKSMEHSLNLLEKTKPYFDYHRFESLQIKTKMKIDEKNPNDLIISHDVKFNLPANKKESIPFSSVLNSKKNNKNTSFQIKSEQEGPQDLAIGQNSSLIAQKTNSSPDKSINTTENIFKSPRFYTPTNPFGDLCTSLNSKNHDSIEKGNSQFNFSKLNADGEPQNATKETTDIKKGVVNALKTNEHRSVNDMVNSQKKKNSLALQTEHKNQKSSNSTEESQKCLLGRKKTNSSPNISVDTEKNSVRKLKNKFENEKFCKKTEMVQSKYIQKSSKSKENEFFKSGEDNIFTISESSKISEGIQADYNAKTNNIKIPHPNEYKSKNSTVFTINTHGHENEDNQSIETLTMPGHCLDVRDNKNRDNSSTKKTSLSHQNTSSLLDDKNTFIPVDLQKTDGFAKKTHTAVQTDHSNTNLKENERTRNQEQMIMGTKSQRDSFNYNKGLRKNEYATKSLFHRDSLKINQKSTFFASKNANKDKRNSYTKNENFELHGNKSAHKKGKDANIESFHSKNTKDLSVKPQSMSDLKKIHTKPVSLEMKATAPSFHPFKTPTNYLEKASHNIFCPPPDLQTNTQSLKSKTVAVTDKKTPIDNKKQPLKENKALMNPGTQRTLPRNTIIIKSTEKENIIKDDKESKTVPKIAVNQNFERQAYKSAHTPKNYTIRKSKVEPANHALTEKGQYYTNKQKSEKQDKSRYNPSVNASIPKKVLPDRKDVFIQQDYSKRKNYNVIANQKQGDVYKKEMATKGNASDLSESLKTCTPCSETVFETTNLGKNGLDKENKPSLLSKNIGLHENKAFSQTHPQKREYVSHNDLQNTNKHIIVSHAKSETDKTSKKEPIQNTLQSTGDSSAKYNQNNHKTGEKCIELETKCVKGHSNLKIRDSTNEKIAKANYSQENHNFAYSEKPKQQVFIDGFSEDENRKHSSISNHKTTNLTQDSSKQHYSHQYLNENKQIIHQFVDSKYSSSCKNSINNENQIQPSMNLDSKANSSHETNQIHRNSENSTKKNTYENQKNFEANSASIDTNSSFSNGNKLSQDQITTKGGTDSSSIFINNKAMCPNTNNSDFVSKKNFNQRNCEKQNLDKNCGDSFKIIPESKLCEVSACSNGMKEGLYKFSDIPAQNNIPNSTESYVLPKKSDLQNLTNNITPKNKEKELCLAKNKNSLHNGFTILQTKNTQNQIENPIKNDIVSLCESNESNSFEKTVTLQVLSEENNGKNVTDFYPTKSEKSLKRQVKSELNPENQYSPLDVKNNSSKADEKHEMDSKSDNLVPNDFHSRLINISTSPRDFLSSGFKKTVSRNDHSSSDRLKDSENMMNEGKTADYKHKIDPEKTMLRDFETASDVSNKKTKNNQTNEISLSHFIGSEINQTQFRDCQSTLNENKMKMPPEITEMISKNSSSVRFIEQDSKPSSLSCLSRRNQDFSSEVGFPSEIKKSSANIYSITNEKKYLNPRDKTSDSLQMESVYPEISLSFPSKQPNSYEKEENKIKINLDNDSSWKVSEKNFSSQKSVEIEPSHQNILSDLACGFKHCVKTNDSSSSVAKNKEKADNINISQHSTKNSQCSATLADPKDNFSINYKNELSRNKHNQDLSGIEKHANNSLKIKNKSIGIQKLLIDEKPPSGGFSKKAYVVENTLSDVFANLKNETSKSATNEVSKSHSIQSFPHLSIETDEFFTKNESVNKHASLNKDSEHILSNEITACVENSSKYDESKKDLNKASESITSSVTKDMKHNSKITTTLSDNSKNDSNASKYKELARISSSDDSKNDSYASKYKKSPRISSSDDIRTNSEEDLNSSHNSASDSQVIESRDTNIDEELFIIENVFENLRYDNIEVSSSKLRPLSYTLITLYFLEKKIYETSVMHVHLFNAIGTDFHKVFIIKVTEVLYKMLRFRIDPFSEIKFAKQLGLLIGSMSIAKNRIFPLDLFNPKKYLSICIQNKKLYLALFFISHFLKQGSKGLIFRPNNPFLIRLMDLLSEVAYLQEKSIFGNQKIENPDEYFKKYLYAPSEIEKENLQQNQRNTTEILDVLSDDLSKYKDDYFMGIFHYISEIEGFRRHFPSGFGNRIINSNKIVFDPDYEENSNQKFAIDQVNGTKPTRGNFIDLTQLAQRKKDRFLESESNINTEENNTTSILDNKFSSDFSHGPTSDEKLSLNIVQNFKEPENCPSKHPSDQNIGAYMLNGSNDQKKHKFAHCNEKTDACFSNIETNTNLFQNFLARSENHSSIKTAEIENKIEYIYRNDAKNNPGSDNISKNAVSTNDELYYSESYIPENYMNNREPGVSKRILDNLLANSDEEFMSKSNTTNLDRNLPQKGTSPEEFREMQRNDQKNVQDNIICEESSDFRCSVDFEDNMGNENIGDKNSKSAESVNENNHLNAMNTQNQKYNDFFTLTNPNDSYLFNYGIATSKNQNTSNKPKITQDFFKSTRIHKSNKNDSKNIGDLRYNTVQNQSEDDILSDTKNDQDKICFRKKNSAESKRCNSSSLSQENMHYSGSKNDFIFENELTLDLNSQKPAEGIVKICNLEIDSLFKAFNIERKLKIIQEESPFMSQYAIEINNRLIKNILIVSIEYSVRELANAITDRVVEIASKTCTVLFQNYTVNTIVPFIKIGTKSLKKSIQNQEYADIKQINISKNRAKNSKFPGKPSSIRTEPVSQCEDHEIRSEVEETNIKSMDVHPSMINQELAFSMLQNNTHLHLGDSVCSNCTQKRFLLNFILNITKNLTRISSLDTIKQAIVENSTTFLKMAGQQVETSKVQEIALANAEICSHLIQRHGMTRILMIFPRIYEEIIKKSVFSPPKNTFIYSDLKTQSSSVFSDMKRSKDANQDILGNLIESMQINKLQTKVNSRFFRHSSTFSFDCNCNHEQIWRAKAIESIFEDILNNFRNNSFLDSYLSSFNTKNYQKDSLHCKTPENLNGSQETPNIVYKTVLSEQEETIESPKNQHGNARAGLHEHSQVSHKNKSNTCFNKTERNASLGDLHYKEEVFLFSSLKYTHSEENCNLDSQKSVPKLNQSEHSIQNDLNTDLDLYLESSAALSHNLINNLSLSFHFDLRVPKSLTILSSPIFFRELYIFSLTIHEIQKTKHYLQEISNKNPDKIVSQISKEFLRIKEAPNIDEIENTLYEIEKSDITDTLSINFCQMVIGHLLKHKLRREIMIYVIKRLFFISFKAFKEVNQWFIYSEDDRKLAPDFSFLFFKNNLVNKTEFDIHLARLLRRKDIRSKQLRFQQEPETLHDLRNISSNSKDLRLEDALESQDTKKHNSSIKDAIYFGLPDTIKSSIASNDIYLSNHVDAKSDQNFSENRHFYHLNNPQSISNDSNSFRISRSGSFDTNKHKISNEISTIFRQDASKNDILTQLSSPHSYSQPDSISTNFSLNQFQNNHFSLNYKPPIKNEKIHEIQKNSITAFEHQNAKNNLLSLSIKQKPDQDNYKSERSFNLRSQSSGPQDQRQKYPVYDDLSSKKQPYDDFIDSKKNHTYASHSESKNLKRGEYDPKYLRYSLSILKNLVLSESKICSPYDFISTIEILSKINEDKYNEDIYNILNAISTMLMPTEYTHEINNEKISSVQGIEVFDEFEQYFKNKINRVFLSRDSNLNMIKNNIISANTIPNTVKSNHQKILKDNISENYKESRNRQGFLNRINSKPDIFFENKNQSEDKQTGQFSLQQSNLNKKHELTDAKESLNSQNSTDSHYIHTASLGCNNQGNFFLNFENNDTNETLVDIMEKEHLSISKGTDFENYDIFSTCDLKNSAILALGTLHKTWDAYMYHHRIPSSFSFKRIDFLILNIERTSEIETHIKIFTHYLIEAIERKNYLFIPLYTYFICELFKKFSNPDYFSTRSEVFELFLSVLNLINPISIPSTIPIYLTLVGSDFFISNLSYKSIHILKNLLFVAEKGSNRSVCHIFTKIYRSNRRFLENTAFFLSLCCNNKLSTLKNLFNFCKSKDYIPKEVHSAYSYRNSYLEITALIFSKKIEVLHEKFSTVREKEFIWSIHPILDHIPMQDKEISFIASSTITFILQKYPKYSRLIFNLVEYRLRAAIFITEKTRNVYNEILSHQKCK